MSELKTDDQLLHVLRTAAGRKQSAAELREQRVSFVMSTLNESGDVTRAKVRDLLAEQEGQTNR